MIREAPAVLGFGLVILLTAAGVQDFQRRAADAGALRASLKACLPDVTTRGDRCAPRGLRKV
jgi:hypothetical protein